MRERFDEHLLPLSRYQANCDIAVMLSWYSAGYGWLGSYGSWYGSRSGRWLGNAEDVWFSVTCRMALQRCGTNVLSWNVAGDVFLSLASNVGDLKPGMTDFFHVGELILRPQLTDDLNDFMSASAAHMTVMNSWLNTHTELELPTVPVVWSNTALCEDVETTIVQKLWMLEQMDCGRAGLVQDDIRARMKAGESLVDLMASMTSTMTSMVNSLVAPVDASWVASKASLVASMAPLVASMVEALDWLKQSPKVMTNELTGFLMVWFKLSLGPG